VTPPPATDDFLRLAEQLEERLAARPARDVDVDGRAPAGVLVPLFPDPPAGLSTLLTLRTQTVRDHKGQVSFPGGVREELDADLLATALREAEEEIGLPPAAVRPVGRLDDCPTLTGYVIRPFVGLLRGRPAVRASPVEIERVLVVPLSELSRPGACRFEQVETGGWTVESHVFEVDGQIVWGATARMLVDLLARIGTLG
jgi:8-oxo-dGTP pyrophosphatase MutT (NUDIX family)